MGTASCAVCSTETRPLFTHKVLGRYDVRYDRCPACGLVQSEKPYWLTEAYRSPIPGADSGILRRNLQFRALTAAVVLACVGRHARLLDYAGGYGILTRFMRDLGFDAYWTDPYCQNLFARGFEHRAGQTYDLVTAFEMLEHAEDPKETLASVLALCRRKNLLLSTHLCPPDVTPDWWYFSFDTGQHIRFFTLRSLQLLAEHFGLRLLSNGANIHFLTEQGTPLWRLRLALRLAPVAPWCALRLNGAQPHPSGGDPL